MIQSETARILTAEGFHTATADHSHLVCLFHRGAAAEAGAALQAIAGDAPAPWTWSRVDLDAAPDLGSLFGLEGAGPFLLVMRERVVLYCDPLGTRPAPLTRALIDRAAELSMPQVQEELEQNRQRE